MSTPPPCVPKFWLFLSTDLEDHEQAKAICATCPLTDWCEEEYRAAKRAAYSGGEPEGTWAGKLRRPPRRPSKPRQTHCIHGHERTPQNLYKGGQCRPCALAKSKRNYSTNRGRSNGELLPEWEHLESLGVGIEQAARQLGVTVAAIRVAERRAKGSAA